MQQDRVRRVGSDEDSDDFIGIGSLTRQVDVDDVTQATGKAGKKQKKTKTKKQRPPGYVSLAVQKAAVEEAEKLRLEGSTLREAMKSEHGFANTGIKDVIAVIAKCKKMIGSKSVDVLTYDRTTESLSDEDVLTYDSGEVAFL